MAKKTFIPASKNYGLDIFTLPFAAKKSDLPFYVSDAEAPEMIRSGAAGKNEAVTPVKNTESKSSGISASSGSDAARQSVINTSANKTVNTEPYTSKSKDRREGAAEIAERLYPELTGGERGALEREGSTLDTLGADLQNRKQNLDALLDVCKTNGSAATLATFNNAANAYNKDLTALKTRYNAYKWKVKEYNATAPLDYITGKTKPQTVTNDTWNTAPEVEDWLAPLLSMRSEELGPKHNTGDTTGNKTLDKVIDYFGYTTGKIGTGMGSVIPEIGQGLVTLLGDLVNGGEYSDSYKTLKSYFLERPSLLQRAALSDRAALNQIEDETGVTGDVLNAYLITAQIDMADKSLDTTFGANVSEGYKDTFGDLAYQIGKQLPAIMLTMGAAPSEAGGLIGKAIAAVKEGGIKNIGTGIADGLKLALKGNFATALIGANAAADKYVALGEQTGSNSLNYINAFATGYIEHFTEGLFGYSDAASYGNAFSKILGETADKTWSGVKRYAINGFEEGLEEVVNVPLEGILDKFTVVSGKKWFGDDGIFDWNMMRKNGVSGMMMGYIMGGVGSIASVYSAAAESGDFRSGAEAMNSIVDNMPSDIPDSMRPAKLNSAAATAETLDLYTAEMLTAYSQYAKMVQQNTAGQGTQNQQNSQRIGQVAAGQQSGIDPVIAALIGGGQSASGTVSKSTAAQQATPDVSRALLGWDTQTPNAAATGGSAKGFNVQDVPYDIRALLGMTDDSAAGTVSKSTAAQQESPDVSRALLGWNTQTPDAAATGGNAKGFNIQDVPYDIRALLGMTDDSAAGTVSKSTAAQQEAPDVSRALLGWDTQTPGANSRAAPAVGEAKGFSVQDVPYDIRALLGMTDDSAAGTVSKTTAAQREAPDVSRALLGWDTQAPGANRQAVPAVGEAKGFNIQAVPNDIRALLGWEGKNAVENGSAPGYNNNWKNTAEASSFDSLADNPLLLTGKYGKYRDSTNPDLPLPPGLQDDASASSYIDTQKAYEAARAEMEQSGDLSAEGAGKTTLKPIHTGNLKVMETKTPEVANNEWQAKGYDKPPYDPNFKVNIVQAGSESYVRVFSYNTNGTSNKLGGWIMLKSDIEGLTPVQIADKYALPKVPTHICDIIIRPGYELQTGIANRVDEWGQGGGQQFDTIGKRLPISSFVNERKIGE